MEIPVTRSDDPSWVLDHAGAFLASDPVRHNIILTLLHARVAHPEPGRYWIAGSGSQVAGVVLQSPLEFHATLTPMAPEVVAAVVDRIASDGVELPGVNGEAATAAHFAGCWTERTKAAAIPYQGLRLYQLGEVMDLPPAPGRLRLGTVEDRELVIDWVRRFQTEIGEHLTDAGVMVDQWQPAGQLWIWDTGTAVSMAVTRDAVESVVRIAAVYTPRDLRQRGYAGSCVSELSRRIRARVQRPILYTDLGNPTSNSLYRRIGFIAVAEALRYRFE